ncbi:U32 family peptidase [Marinobacteraceae bacterium S3BR75-40.1]
MTQEPTMDLTLGPILWYWPREQVQAFYREAADWPVDTVCLGETVCSRRREMKLQDWLTIARELREAGKQVRLASQSLIESEGDLRDLYKLCKNGEVMVEAGEQSAIQILSRAGLSFTTGPGVNIYNPTTLTLLQRDGLRSWCAPVELSRETIAALVSESRALGVEADCEVFAWGYLPLAIAARCMTARHYDLPKDKCQFVCRDHPHGLTLQSRESRTLFTLNGVQTLSGVRCDLLREVPKMREMGVRSVRLSPEQAGMLPVIERFRAACDGATVSQDPLAMVDTDACNGYWYGQPGMDWYPASNP